jgi:hypothetical protein
VLGPVGESKSAGLDKNGKTSRFRISDSLATWRPLVNSSLNKRTPPAPLASSSVGMGATHGTNSSLLPLRNSTGTCSIVGIVVSDGQI